MGVVVRQSILASIISYAGVVVGYINLLYLYPKFLEVGQIGLLRTIQDAAILLVPFAQMGLSHSIIRFFPHFNKDEKSAHGFITLMLALSVAGFAVFWIVFSFAKQPIVQFFNDPSLDIAPYLPLISWLTFLLLITTLLEAYSRSLLKIAFPNFLREVVIRLLQAVLVSLYFLQWMSFGTFLILNIGIYVITLLTLAGYLAVGGHLKLHFDFSFITGKRLMEMLQFSALSFVGTSGLIIIAKVDSLMVAGLLSFASNAIYTTAFYMATVIEVPKRAITQTTMPLIAEAFEKNNLRDIESIYKKVSLNQFIIGSLLLIGIWANLHNIFALVPKGDVFEAGALVVVLIGSGKLLDMMFGPSTEIIVLSKYYGFNIVVISILAITVIGLNLLLIPTYGITGAAAGSAIALLLFNAIKFVFIYFTFKLQPFTLNTFKVIGIASVTVVVNYFLPKTDIVFLDIFYRSGIITLLFGSMILLFNCSDEVNKLLHKALSVIGWR